MIEEASAMAETEERSVGQLVADATREISDLVRHEIALAKAEIKGDVIKGATAGGMFGAAGYLGFLATIVLTIAAGLGLATVMPGWLAFLVLALILLLVAGILAFIGLRTVKKVRPPERTIRTAQRSIATIRRGSGATGRS